MSETRPAPSSLRMPGGHYADPALVFVAGRYYLYPTTDGVEGWGADSFSAFSSLDLREWTDHGVILRLAGEIAWASRYAWAPTMAEHAGRFYFYFTAEHSIGVAVGDSPVGPFRDLGAPLVPAGAYPGSAIDPSVFVDVDGTAYLLWGNTVLHMVPLGEDMMSFDPAQVRSWSPTAFREAAWMHERAGRYYLSWSENDTREEDYRVRYATADAPTGPWTDGGLLLQKNAAGGVLGTGHHSVLRLPGGDDWVVAYHYFRPGEGGYRRRLAIDRLHFEGDGSLRPIVPAPGSWTHPHHQRGKQ